MLILALGECLARALPFSLLSDFVLEARLLMAAGFADRGLTSFFTEAFLTANLRETEAFLAAIMTTFPAFLEMGVLAVYLYNVNQSRVKALDLAWVCF